MEKLYLWIALAPLIGAIIAGLFGKQIGKTGAHLATIAGVGFSTIASMMVLKYLVIDGGDAYNASVKVHPVCVHTPQSTCPRDKPNFSCSGDKHRNERDRLKLIILCPRKLRQSARKQSSHSLL